jgi:two-component system KDP operon response regulator KdpE
VPEKFSVLLGNYHALDINQIHNYDPDVIIMNLNIHKNDGIAVIQKIRHSSKLPILVITNINKPGMMEKTLDAGADEYLIRPVSETLLLAYLNTLARRAKAEKKARKILFGEVQRRDTRPQFV